MKLTKKERERITRNMATIERGETFVGFRPSVMVNKSVKYNKKSRRAESRAICRAW